MCDLAEDKQKRRKGMVFGWMSATILLNASATLLSASKWSASGWTLFAVGFGLLILALQLVRSSR